VGRPPWTGWACRSRAADPSSASLVVQSYPRGHALRPAPPRDVTFRLAAHRHGPRAQDGRGDHPPPCYHDTLTLLPNRLLFRDRLSSAGPGERREELLAVMFLDLDRFKNINDTLGHAAATGCCRSGPAPDRAPAGRRHGGAPGRRRVHAGAARRAAGRDAARLGHEILETVRPPLARRARAARDRQPGVSLFPTTAGTSRRLVKHADIALYRAKECGGQLPALQPRHERALAGAADAREPPAHGRRARRVRAALSAPGRAGQRPHRGVEALLRWRAPDGRLVPPGEFVPLCEDTG